jgi:Na+/H+ antiporter NhaC
MRLFYWFLLILLVVGFVLFIVGQYYMSNGESRLGYGLSISGIVAFLILLAIGMLYLARVRVKILSDARRF